LNQDAADESWGIRDLAIMANEVPPVPDLIEMKPPAGFHMAASAFTGYKLTEEDVADWVFYGNNGKISECNGVYLVGGFNKFGKGAGIKKKFTKLGSHDKVIVAF